MKKKRSERLDVILRLAQQREEQATRALGIAQSVLAAEQQKHVELTQYEQEYVAAMPTGAENTVVNPTLVINWNLFLRRMRLAISQQGDVIVEAEKRLQQRLIAWQKAHMKRQSLHDLVKRARSKEGVLEEKKIQRDIDDRSTLRSHVARESGR